MSILFNSYLGGQASTWPGELKLAVVECWQASVHENFYQQNDALLQDTPSRRSAAPIADLTQPIPRNLSPRYNPWTPGRHTLCFISSLCFSIICHSYSLPAGSFPFLFFLFSPRPVFLHLSPYSSHRRPGEPRLLIHPWKTARPR